MAVETPICDFGWQAPEFRLPATDGKTYALADIRGPKGTLIMFICNHCPYVIGVIDRIVRDAAALQELGIGVAAICTNDAESYPADSFEKMGEFSAKNGFTFRYLHDESQAVGRAYDAVCTPDFFGFDASLGLQYRGRLDASRREAGAADLKRELYEAMKGVARNGRGPEHQIASMGCSIKWKPAG
jgi:peroxiredoxin